MVALIGAAIGAHAGPLGPLNPANGTVKGLNFIMSDESNRFPGSGETLTRANFPGIIDSPSGVFSVWFCSIRLNDSPTSGNSAGFFNLLNGWLPGGNGSFDIETLPSNPALRWFAYDVVGYRTYSNSEMVGSVCDARWHHILMSWDRTNGTMVMMVDRWQPYVYTTADATPSTVNYSVFTEWDIGSGCGNLAEMWFQPGLTLDITDPTILNKFVDADGVPVDLGPTGANVTGSAPLLYLSVRGSNPAEFFVNRGWGGGSFTIMEPQVGSGFAISERVPTVENPIRVIPGTVSDLTMRTAHYANLDLGYDPGTNIIFRGGIGMITLNGSIDHPTIFNPPHLTANDTLTPIAANFATLLDDGVTTTLNALSTPRPFGLDLAADYAVTRGTSCVYIVSMNTYFYPPVFYVTILSLTDPMTMNGPFPILGIDWMDAELANGLTSGRNLAPYASIMNWGGKEQCVCYFSSVYENGRAVMVDRDGNITQAKIWDGFNGWEEWQLLSGPYLTVLTIPNGTNNYFLVTMDPQSSEDVTLRIVQADNLGHNLSSTLVHADNLSIDMVINGPYTDSRNDPAAPPIIWAIDLNAGATGYAWSGVVNFQAPTFLVKLDPACTSYTAHRLIPEAGDELANRLLINSDFDDVTPSPFFGANHHYAVFASNIGGVSGVLWDGPATPDYTRELKQVNLLPLNSFYPMSGASDVFALLFDVTNNMPLSFSQLSLSVWCCDSVDLRAPYFDDPTIFMQFRTDHVLVRLKDNDRNLLFQATFVNPQAPTDRYHVAFSVDTQAQHYTFYGNGVIWPSSDVTFPNVGGIGNNP